MAPVAGAGEAVTELYVLSVLDGVRMAGGIMVAASFLFFVCGVGMTLEASPSARFVNEKDKPTWLGLGRMLLRLAALSCFVGTCLLAFVPSSESFWDARTRLEGRE
jgi:hypothetical protein